VNLAFRLSASGESAESLSQTLPGSLQVNRRLSDWLEFKTDAAGERYLLIKPGKVEIGQGIHTALVQLAADQLYLSASQIKVQTVTTGMSPDEAVTSGSLSVQECGLAISHACAQARELLLSAIAHREQRPVEVLTVQEGVVYERSTAAICTYWDIDATRLLQVTAQPQSPLRTDAAQYVGKSLKRLDLAAKFAGKPVFIQDLRMPNMQFALVVRGAWQAQAVAMLKSANLSLQIVQDRLFVAVVAKRLSVIEQAQRVITIVQDKYQSQLSPQPWLSDSWFDTGLTSSERLVVQRRGDAFEPNAAKSSNTLDYVFTKPWLAHASIGLSCAVASFEPEVGLRVFSHSQGIYNLRQDLQLAFPQLALEQIVVQHWQGAGCYGHNGADDVAFDAARVALAIPGVPIRMQWTRYQELADAPYSPAMQVRVKASLSADRSQIVQWHQAVVSNGHSLRPGRAVTPTLLGAAEIEGGAAPRASINPPLAAGGGADRNAVPGYDIAQSLVENHYLTHMPIRASAFRALGAIANVWAIESVMDELASMAQVDAKNFRLQHLTVDSRAQGVIQRAAAMSDWPNQSSLGLGYARYKNSGAWCCVVAKVSCEEKVKVEQLWIAADVGLAINPDGVLNQLEGGAIQATSIALLEEARWAYDASVHANWENYPILRFSEVPLVEIELLNNKAQFASVGAGEAATAPVIAAIANAITRSLGIRLTHLPFTPETIAAH
jgi:CO/xanthine dehydrogenase Mo-binding subunit